MFNRVQLIGNVGADPEIRRTQDGRPIANIRLATSESWRDKSTGERREKVEWHRVVIFNEGLCKVVEQYVKKGSKLFVEGSLQTRKWTDKDNTERYSTEVVLQAYNGTIKMLDSKRDREDSGDSSGEDDHSKYNSRRDDRRPAGGGRRDDMDDEIPF